MKKINLRKQFNAILYSILIVISVTAVIFYFCIIMPYINANKINSKNIISQVLINFNMIVRNVDQIQDTLKYDSYVQSYLTSDNMINKLDLSNIIYILTSTVKTFNDDIISVSIFNKDGEETVFYAENNVGNMSRRVFYSGYKSGKLGQGLNFLDDEMKQNSKESYFCNISPVYNISKEFRYKDEIGTVIVIFKADGMRKVFDKLELSDASSFFIVDKNNMVCLSSNGKQTGDYINLEQYSGSIENIEGTDWKILGSSVKNNYYNNLETLILILSIMIVLYLIIILMIKKWVSLKFLIPVQKILTEIDSIEKQGSFKNVNLKIDGELNIIVSTINRLIDTMHDTTRKMLNTQQRLYEAEVIRNKVAMDMLKSQINPHFLYNTLGCIKNTAMKYSANEIVQMTAALIDLFKYSIKGSDYVSVRREIEIIKQYLLIMEYRFKGKYKVNININDEVFDKKILKMIIQPIVENAISHGLEMMEGTGVLTINGAIVHNRIELSVSDNGVGIDDAEIEKIKFALNNPNDQNDDKMGLVNVNQRIRLTYGEPYGLTINSKKDAGCTVTIILPV